MTDVWTADIEPDVGLVSMDLKVIAICQVQFMWREGGRLLDDVALRVCDRDRAQILCACRTVEKGRMPDDGAGIRKGRLGKRIRDTVNRQIDHVDVASDISFQGEQEIVSSLLALLPRVVTSIHDDGATQNCDRCGDAQTRPGQPRAQQNRPARRNRLRGADGKSGAES